MWQAGDWWGFMMKLLCLRTGLCGWGCSLGIMLILAAGAGQAQTAPGADPTPDEIIQFLDQSIAWYRQMDVERQMASEPQELLLVNENQQMANQAIALAFDFARAEAVALASVEKQMGPPQPGSQEAGGTRYQALRRFSTTLDQQIRDTRAEVEALRQKLPGAAGKELRALQSQIGEVQSELDLAEARKAALQSMVEFVGGASTNGLGATGLRADIEALARTVPAALTKPASTQENASSGGGQVIPGQGTGAWKPTPSGIWGLATDLFALSRKDHALADGIRLTGALTDRLRQLRTPLVNRMRDMSRRGDDLAKQADAAGPLALVQEKKQLDELTAQFKQGSASVIPLSKLGVLLDLYQRNLDEWQGTVRSKSGTDLRSLLIRLGFLVLFLIAAFAAAELWRRTIFRYVRDVRRRHQFLLLRKIVLWCVIAVILVFTFANELGSVATFAGLMTAGVAVALQSVILSIAGYFFLIGKFGIRVGDRVYVSGVTGEVVDIGLVRFHLLEVVGSGGKTPTGRVVAFSNSIVFQSSAGLFKQIPGTNFGWHEVAVSLPPDKDYAAVETRLRGAVEAVFSDYRQEMEQQHRQLERTLTIAPVGELKPRSRLQLSMSGLDLVIGYPVDLMHAGEIDDRVTRELLKVIEGEQKLRSAGTGASAIGFSNSKTQRLEDSKKTDPDVFAS